jgi:hypothetical protein
VEGLLFVNRGLLPSRVIEKWSPGGVVFGLFLRLGFQGAPERARAILSLLYRCIDCIRRHKKNAYRVDVNMTDKSSKAQPACRKDIAAACRVTFPPDGFIAPLRLAAIRHLEALAQILAQLRLPDRP